MLPQPTITDHWPAIQTFLATTSRQQPSLIVAPPGRSAQLAALFSTPVIVLLPSEAAVQVFRQNYPRVEVQNWSDFKDPRPTVTYLADILQPGDISLDLAAAQAKILQAGARLILLSGIPLPSLEGPLYEVVTEAVQPEVIVEPPDEDLEPRLLTLLREYDLTSLPGAFLVYLPDRQIRPESLQAVAPNRSLYITTPQEDLKETGVFSLVLDAGRMRSRVQTILGGVREQEVTIPALLAQAHARQAAAIYHVLTPPRTNTLIIPPPGRLAPRLQQIWQRVPHNYTTAVVLALIDGYGPYFLYPEPTEDASEDRLRRERHRRHYFGSWRGVDDVDTLVHMWEALTRAVPDVTDPVAVTTWANANSVDSQRLLDVIATLRYLGQLQMTPEQDPQSSWERLRAAFAETYADQILEAATTPEERGRVYYDRSHRDDYWLESQYTVNDLGRLVPAQLIPLVITTTGLQPGGQVSRQINVAMAVGPLSTEPVTVRQEDEGIDWSV